ARRPAAQRGGDRGRPGSGGHGRRRLGRQPAHGPFPAPGTGAESGKHRQGLGPGPRRGPAPQRGRPAGPGLRGGQQRAGSRWPRRRLADRAASGRSPPRADRPPAALRRRPGYRRGRRAVRGGGWPPLRPRPRPAERLASSGLAQRQRPVRRSRPCGRAFDGVFRRWVRARRAVLRQPSRDPRPAHARRRLGATPSLRELLAGERGEAMTLTAGQQAAGRRNFLKAVAGTPALALLGAAALKRGPVRGGPVRVGFIGVGGEGRVLLEQTDPAFAEVRALCYVNPAQLAKADDVLAKSGRPPARHYSEWREMLEKENLEAVVIAVPLWMHAEVTAGCLEAGKHVLCEKMMAWDVEGCERMLAAARRSGRLLEIGYQRHYNPIYQAAYEGVVKPEVLGDVYHVRLAWHRNGNWRRSGEPPSPDYDPS